MRFRRAVGFFMILPLVSLFPRGAHGAPDGKALIQGLDHVPVAVRDLDAAAERLA